MLNNTSFKNKNQAFTKAIIIILNLFIIFSFFLPLVVNAQGLTPDTCNFGESVDVKWWNIVNPGRFLPIIPDECALVDGRIARLSPALIPDVLFRLYSFLVSLLFVLILPVITFAGVQYSWSGLFGAGETAKAKKLLTNSALSLAVVSIFYGAVMVILSFFGGDDILSSADLSSFFSF